MNRAIALSLSPSVPFAERLRSLIVLGCALSLIMAGRALPF